MKRITIFSGHYGSGKTNVAINYAVKLGKEGNPVSIADLDIVNPYFRTKDSEELFEKNGIELISLPFANTSVDLPSMPSAAYGLFERRDRKVIIDLGGDDRGALALGRFRPRLLEENDYEMIFTVNFYRPLTTTVEEAYEVFKEIEYASKLKFTKIVNNSNLGIETGAEDVLKTVALANELAEKTGTELLFTSVDESVYDEVTKVLSPEKVFKLKLQEKIF
ncbi:MAG: MinD/ParA family protein [Ruminococcaceae bacterium]|nr:MinD/ParA family protein [Oscillospiraceae bacterium]